MNKTRQQLQLHQLAAMIQMETHLELRETAQTLIAQNRRLRAEAQQLRQDCRHALQQTYQTRLLAGTEK